MLANVCQSEVLGSIIEQILLSTTRDITDHPYENKKKEESTKVRTSHVFITEELAPSSQFLAAEAFALNNHQLSGLRVAMIYYIRKAIVKFDIPR